MNAEQKQFFRDYGFVNLGKLLTDEEVVYFDGLFNADRQTYPYFWHPYGHHQHANYEALLTTPQFLTLALSKRNL